MRHSCPEHLSLFDLIIVIIFGQSVRIMNSSLLIFFQPHATSSLLDPNILLSTLFSYTLNYIFLLV